MHLLGKVLQHAYISGMEEMVVLVMLVMPLVSKDLEHLIVSIYVHNVAFIVQVHDDADNVDLVVKKEEI